MAEEIIIAQKKMVFKIDTEKCKGCELCTMYCPKKCIELAETYNDAGHHPVRMTAKDNCNCCGICYTMCPDYVIEITARK